MSSYDYTFKVMILGDDFSGKTAFIKRFCYNIFNPSERLTIGVDFHTKTMRSLGKTLKLQLWEVGGEERFRFLLPTYCLGANAAILMYDITKPSTLEKVSEWTSIIRSKSGDIPIVLIGSKLYSEEPQSVSTKEGRSVAENFSFSAFKEICPENGQNVDQIFEVLGELLIERSKLNRKQSDYKINDYLELRLENARTNIYIGGRLFNQCKYLLLNSSIDSFKKFDEIESIDEATENLDRTMEVHGRNNFYISPETEFWGHCSNLQAWYESNYDTRILHRSLAFPLLKELVDAGDKLAKRAFKEQLALRLENGYPFVVLFLVNQGYLNYLTEEELDTILKSPKFLKNMPKWFKYNKNIPDRLIVKIRALFNDLQCPYCNTKIEKNIIQRLLNGEIIRCEFCYSNLI
jgi:small GTP-binding protein